MDRYAGIHSPLKNRNKSSGVVAVKISAVWLTSTVIGSPLIALGVFHPEQILNESQECAIFNAYFLIYGSLVAFFGPLSIMLVALSLTVRLLNRQAEQLGLNETDTGMRRCKADRKRQAVADARGGQLELRLMMPLGITGAIAEGRRPFKFGGELGSNKSEVNAAVGNRWSTNLVTNQIQSPKDKPETSGGNAWSNIRNVQPRHHVDCVTEEKASDHDNDDIFLNVPPSAQCSRSNSESAPLIEFETVGLIKITDRLKSSIFGDVRPKIEQFIKHVSSPSMLGAEQSNLRPVTVVKREPKSTIVKVRYSAKEQKNPGSWYRPETIVTDPRINLDGARSTSAAANDVRLSVSDNKIADKLQRDVVDKIVPSASFNKAFKSDRTTEPYCKYSDVVSIAPSTSWTCDEIVGNALHRSVESNLHCQLSTHCNTKLNGGIAKFTSRQLRLSYSLDVTDSQHDCYSIFNEQEVISKETNIESMSFTRDQKRKALNHQQLLEISCEKDDSTEPLANDLKIEESVKNCNDRVNEGAITDKVVLDDRNSGALPDNRAIPDEVIVNGSRIATNVNKSVDGETENSASGPLHTAVPKPALVNGTKFKSLVKKHGAAFQVAGILQARREDRRKTEVNSVKTEQKAIKVIGTMFVMFFVCWAPFFAANLTLGVCPNCNIDVRLFKLFLWLGYASSTLNPIIYTIFNQTFKETFVRLLKCECCVPSFRRSWSVSARSYGRELLLAADTTSSNVVRRPAHLASYRHRNGVKHSKVNAT